jgi:hypothetical protein
MLRPFESQKWRKVSNVTRAFACSLLVERCRKMQTDRKIAHRHKLEWHPDLRQTTFVERYFLRENLESCWIRSLHEVATNLKPPATRKDHAQKVFYVHTKPNEMQTDNAK